MADLPIHDRVGNALLEVRLIAEDELARVAARMTVPASLVVVRCADAVLLVFDRHRREWELPGGMRESGESPRAAAVRELAEETGIQDVTLVCAALAEFSLVQPSRREWLAVYRTEVRNAPTLIVNEEISGFRWWHPTEPITEDTSPLDTEIARRVLGGVPPSP